jgi:hypothetical protein
MAAGEPTDEELMKQMHDILEEAALDIKTIGIEFEAR